ncbi:hypothetical protein GCM10022198_24070 [Klugiella xanthotipulae]|uniref:Uncharacterized protein n=1 Tax=Klugiella xanthotipulae TaxID=244735 RepID=A0A543I6A6_9MICO|nr:hypothetical protein FB466_0976 [Klugiella xanthotipulae]
MRPGVRGVSRLRVAATIVAFILVVGSLGTVVAAALVPDADVRIPLGVTASVALVLGLALGVGAVLVRRSDS